MEIAIRSICPNRVGVDAINFNLNDGAFIDFNDDFILFNF